MSQSSSRLIKEQRKSDKLLTRLLPATVAAQLKEHKVTYCVTHQYLKKFSYGFWDNQWFGRNQIYLKLKLGARQFIPGIKNFNFNFNLIIFLNFKQKKFTNFFSKNSKKINFFI
jgi:hypothetical protein